MTTERLDQEPAFVLHSRPYRETSQLVDLLTLNHGRVGCVARGTRARKSNLRGAVQPFQRIVMQAAGRSSLLTLRSAELDGATAGLTGTALMAGFYLNELLLRLLERGDPHPELFGSYALTIAELAAGAAVEPILRGFEVVLLREIGYGLNFEVDVQSGADVHPELNYEYLIERGPARTEAADPGRLRFPGSHLLAISRGEFDDASQLQSARILLRAVLDHYLAGRPLRTRRVMSALRS
jgi:DNA repair protein RecO (recombination protein O)